jgi:hypothetical protein
MTVENDGRLEIIAPELHAGATAEVIVLVTAGISQTSPADRVAALQTLRKAADVTPESAEEWITQIKEREAGHDKMNSKHG